MATRKPMWQCPECQRRFAARGQTHTCSELGLVEAHFEHASPEVRATYDRFVAIVQKLGPVEILAQKTRIAFHARMSFAVLVPRQRWISGHLVLAEIIDAPYFTRVTTYSARNHVHEFRLSSPEDLDETMQRRIAEAYQVGLQRHGGM